MADLPLGPQSDAARSNSANLIAALLVLSLLALLQVGHNLIYNPLVSGPDGDPVSSYYTLAQYLFTLACVAVAVHADNGILKLSGIVAFSPFLLLALISAAWSADLGLTIRSAILLAAFLLAVAASARAIGPYRTNLILTHVMGLVMVGSLLLAVLVPHVGQHNLGDLSQSEHAGSWRGMFIHKNTLGVYAAFTLVLVLAAFRRGLSDPWFLGYLAATLLCLWFSNSTTSLVVAALGGLSYYIVVPALRRAPAFVAVAGGIVLFGAALFLGFGGTDVGGKAETLTGRLGIWEVALDAFSQKPLLGHGFGMGSLVVRPDLQRLVTAEAVDAHSGYVDQLLDLGLIGTALFLLPALLALVGIVWRGGRDRGDNWYTAMVTLILMSLTAAITEVGPFRLTGSAGLFYFYALVQVSLLQRQPNRSLPIESTQMVRSQRLN